MAPNSFWHHEFNPCLLIDSQLTFQADVETVEKYGLVSAYEAAETYALRIAKLVYLAEKERSQAHMQIEKMNRGFTKMEELKKELYECTKERNTLTQQHRELKKAHDDLVTDFQKTKDQAKAVEEAKVSALTELENAQKSFANLEENLSSQKTSFEIELNACKLDAADQYENGFNTDLEQVHKVTPDIDTSECYVWEEIVNGKLVALATEENIEADKDGDVNALINQEINEGNVPE